MKKINWHMKEKILTCVLICLHCFCLTPRCHASDQDNRRVLALVIGNGDYEGMAKLTNATKDAQLVSSTLKEIGVDSVIAGYDLSRARMSELANSFFKAMSDYDVGFIYYAGHGMQDEFNESYLIPVDYALSSSTDVYTNGYEVDRIIKGCARMRDKAFVLFFDASRNNPFSRDFRSSGGGLGEPVVPTEGVLVGYSTESGKVAGDFADQSNGYYAAALSEMLRIPNLKAEDVLKEVGSQVRQKSDFKQNPEWWGNLSGEVIFNYNSEQYEIELFELQDLAIQSVRDFVSENDISRDYSVKGIDFPRDLMSLSASLRAFRNEHLKRNQRRLAEQADLYALYLDFLWSCISGQNSPSALTAENALFDCDLNRLFDENQGFVQMLGLKNPRELGLLVTRMSLQMKPQPGVLKRFFDEMWVEDDVTWFVGMSHFGFQLWKANNSSELKLLPSYHHFELDADTVSAYSAAAYPGVVDLTGLRVLSLKKQNGDTLYTDPKVLDETIVVEVDGVGDVVLTPRSGFVVKDSLFIETPSREEFFRRFVAAMGDLAIVESQERALWGGNFDVPRPEFLRILPFQTLYVAKYNWQSQFQHITYANELPDGGAFEALWTLFEYSFDHLSWQHENDHLSSQTTLLSGLVNFQINANLILFLPEEYISENKKEIVRMCKRVLSTISSIHSDYDFYSGGYQLPDLGGKLGEMVASFGGIIWNLGAFVEYVHSVLPGGVEDLIDESDEVIRQIDLTSIDENTSANAYLIPFLNYEYRKAKRLAPIDDSYPLLRFSEILDLVI